MIDTYFTYPACRRRLRQGPLAPHMDRLAEALHDKGYAVASTKRYLSLIGRFSRAVVHAGCRTIAEIDEATITQFLKTEPATESTRMLAQTALSHTRKYLLEHDLAPALRRASAVALDSVLTTYDVYLRDVRGLEACSRTENIRMARRLLTWFRAQVPEQPIERLKGAQVLTFLREMIASRPTGRAPNQFGSLTRVFLRYLHWAGVLSEDLAPLVPKTPHWRLASIPRHLPWDRVRALIDSIDAATPIGKRDRAMLLLFATLGLRSQEVRRLTLDDLHWKTGVVHIRRTKTRRERVFPLLEEAGNALVDYVLHGRPRVSIRDVFVCHRPPVRPLGGSGTVAEIVRRRLRDCEIEGASTGAHVLRHSLATRMVQGGTPVKAVADLLGHQRIDTTAVYTKVALPQLASVALPFPGGAR